MQMNHMSMATELQELFINVQFSNFTEVWLNGCVMNDKSVT